MAQDLIFKTVAPIFLKCNSILFLAAIMFLKVDNLGTNVELCLLSTL